MILLSRADEKRCEVTDLITSLRAKPETRCQISDLITWMCAHCLGHADDWVDQFLAEEPNE